MIEAPGGVVPPGAYQLLARIFHQGSRMIVVHGRGWALRWSEEHSRSYGSSEARAQARTGPRGTR